MSSKQVIVTHIPAVFPPHKSVGKSLQTHSTPLSHCQGFHTYRSGAYEWQVNITLLSKSLLPGGVRTPLNTPFKQSGDNTQRPLFTFPPRQLRTVIFINLQCLLTRKHKHTLYG